jgi:hypothetical protein
MFWGREERARNLRKKAKKTRSGPWAGDFFVVYDDA